MFRGLGLCGGSSEGIYFVGSSLKGSWIPIIVASASGISALGLGTRGGGIRN